MSIMMEVMNTSCDRFCASFTGSGSLLVAETITDSLMQNITAPDSSSVTKVSYNEDSLVISSTEQNRMRIALGVLIRLVLPLCNGVAKSWQCIRGIRLLNGLQNLRNSRQMLANLLAYAANTISLSLSSVQVYRIEPLLKIIKLKKVSSIERSIECTATKHPAIVHHLRTSRAIDEHIEYQRPEECVTMDILAEPKPGEPHRADVIFIHGLHGSLPNTWRQGLWNSEGKQVIFERPPQPPIRPPKRPRYSRSSQIVAPHVKKRRRYSANTSTDTFLSNSIDLSFEFECKNNDVKSSSSTYTYEYGQPEIIDNCYGIEYSFPTFRLRVDERKNSTDAWKSCTAFDSVNVNARPKSKEAKDYAKCWPGEWLPMDCPGVRVIALNYTTDPYLWRPIWIKKKRLASLAERCRYMTEMLIKERVGYGRPIIWVGHSKGGLYIKQIITEAWESGKLAAAPLWRSARGVFFYSVPHKGSALADVKLPLMTRSLELLELQRNDPFMLDLHRRFLALYQSGHLKIDVFSFAETALTFMSVFYLKIVGVDSADPGIGEVCGVHLDHREICKPRSRKCKLYTELIKMINNTI